VETGETHYFAKPGAANPVSATTKRSRNAILMLDRTAGFVTQMSVVGYFQKVAHYPNVQLAE